MVNGLYLYSAFLVSSSAQSAFDNTSQHSPIHTHIHTLKGQVTSLQRANLLIRNSCTHIHTLMAQPLGAVWVQYLAPGHFDM